MQVRAIKLGIWKNSRVREGVVFEVPDDFPVDKCKWMVRVDAHPADQKAAGKGQAPPAKPAPKAGSQSVI